MKKHNPSRRLTRARVFGSIRLKAPARLKSPARSKKPLAFEWPMSAATTSVVSLGFAAALLTIVFWPSSRGQQATETVAYHLPDARTDRAARSVSAKERAALAARTSVARSSVRNATDVEPVDGPAESKGETSTAGSVEQTAPVTITGCLEADDDTFRLKDTDGAAAPKSRSWRSGFFRKHSATVDLVATGRSVRLPNYVGQRVAATGVLVNHEMQVRSLQRLATSCS